MQTLPSPIAQALAPWAPPDSIVAREAAAIRADVRANETKVARADARKYAIGMADEISRYPFAGVRGALGVR